MPVLKGGVTRAGKVLSSPCHESRVSRKKVCNGRQKRDSQCRTLARCPWIIQGAGAHGAVGMGTVIVGVITGSVARTAFATTQV